MPPGRHARPGRLLSRLARFGVVALLVLGPALAEATSHRTVTVSYVGAADVGLCSQDPTPSRVVSQGKGSVCFAVQAGETTARISIQDFAGTPVYQAGAFKPNGGDHDRPAPSCFGAPTTLNVDGAALVVVFLFEPALAQTRCGRPTTTTMGTVTAEFAR